MENNQQNNFNNQEEETIDLRKLFNYFIGNIQWFILSVVLALGIAYAVNRYSTKIYSVFTTVLIEDKAKGSPLGSNVGGSLDLLSGFGMYPSLENFENQSIILQSYSQVSRTINKLDFEVSYFNQGRIAQFEIYRSAPFEVIFDKTHTQIIGANFQVSIDNEGKINVELKTESKGLFNYSKSLIEGKCGEIDFKTQVLPGEYVETEFFKFYFRIKENFDPKATNNYFFYFNTPDQLTRKYQDLLTLEPMSKGSSMLKISMEDANPLKAIDFLDSLTAEYLYRNLESKNSLATNTIKFIDRQLATISDSLSIAEDNLENFRMTNQVMDLSFQAQQIFEQLQSLENQKMELEIQNSYYNDLLTYIEKNQDIESIMAPSAMGINDPLLNQLILNINQLLVQKSSYFNVQKNADYGPLKEVNAKILSTKQSIYENAKSLVASSELAIKNLNKRIIDYTENINSLPVTERELFGIKRKFELNDNLYTYLLQRHAEAQIAKASNTPDNEVIDSARVSNNGIPIKPKSMINYIIALMLGFILPAVVIALKEYFNMRVDSPDVVKRITTRPIIGYIPNSGSTSDVTISDALDSPWAEAFRIVRAKQQFTIRDVKCPVIVVTSSVPSEGKSFMAINLALVNAIAGKKTLLVGFDLRRPQIAQRFGMDKNLGVTNYLIGEAQLSDIVKTSVQNPNLDIIPSGIIPPNPAELIADERTNKFLEELKKKYDFIILDTAPISPVSDSHHLCRIADATIFVVRDKFTHKQILQASMDELDSNHVKNVSIIMNDIQLNRKRYGSRYGYSYGYRYGYKYGYGYGYGYYQDNGKTKKKKKTQKV